jgi:branched-chain amino acid transport system substrate-binding protein
VFKASTTDRIAAERVLTDMKKRGITKIALLSDTAGFGQSGKAQTESVVAKYGITLVANETYGPKDTDASPQLTKIRNTPGVEAIFVFGFGQGPAIVTKNYEQLGIKLPLYHTHGVASHEFIQLTGKSSENVRISSPALLVVDELPANDAQKAVLASFRDEYRKQDKEDPSTFAGYAYDGLALAVNAIKRAGGTDKAKVRDALEATKGYVGTAGIVTMSATDHMGLDLSSFRLVEIRQGKFKLAH